MHAVTTTAPPPAPAPLPRYSGATSRCPKCHAVDAASTYYPDGRCIHPDEVVRWSDGSGVERICRTCRRCGYQWDEAPLDTPSP